MFSRWAQVLVAEDGAAHRLLSRIFGRRREARTLPARRVAQQEVAIVGTVHTAEIHDAKQQRGLV